MIIFRKCKICAKVLHDYLILTGLRRDKIWEFGTLISWNDVIILAQTGS